MSNSRASRASLIRILFVFVTCVIRPAYGQPPAVTVVPDRSYFDVLMKQIDDARETIDILQFEFIGDEGRVAQVAQKLIDKKRLNPRMRIRIFLEGDEKGFSPDLVKANKRTGEVLARGGCEVTYNVSGNGGLTHAKGFIFDRQIALVGSTNMSNNSLDKNNEMNYLVQSKPIASHIARYLGALVRDGGSALHRYRVADGNVEMMSDDLYFEDAIRTIRDAKKSLDLSMYFLRTTKPEDAQAKQLLAELVEAKRRGVQIRLFLEAGGVHGAEVEKANRDSAAFLAEHGITSVYFDDPARTSHSKFLIRDQEEVLSGSTNWFTGDLELNHQINLRIKEPRLAKSLTTYFSQLIAYDRSTPPGPLHQRIWIGFKRPDLSPEHFRAGVNGKLIPQTANVAAGRGLVGYHPVMLATEGDAALPAEIALISYADEERYRAIRETPAGTAYGDLHWDFFAKKTSRSAVVERDRGDALAFGNGYAVIPSEAIDLQSSEMEVGVLRRRAGMSDADYLASVRAYLDAVKKELGPGLAADAVRVEKDYVLEFGTWRARGDFDKQRRQLARLREKYFDIHRAGLLPEVPNGDPGLAAREGANMQFSRAPVALEEILQPLRDGFRHETGAKRCGADSL